MCTSVVCVEEMTATVFTVYDTGQVESHCLQLIFIGSRLIIMPYMMRFYSQPRLSKPVFEILNSVFLYNDFMVLLAHISRFVVTLYNSLIGIRIWPYLLVCCLFVHTVTCSCAVCCWASSLVTLARQHSTLLEGI